MDLSKASRRAVASRVRLALGLWLREYMASRGMNQRALADLVGRKETYISMILLGQRKPSKRDTQRWAAALKLNEDERAAFMELAGLAHCPEWIAKEYLRMKTELAKKP